MIRQLGIAAIACVLLGVSVEGQARRGGRAPAAAATRTEAAQVECQAPLGRGVQTMRQYCDVLTGRDQAEGIQVTIPPHTGPVTLRFDLHNRHLYSEELVKANRAYRHYTATIGVLTANNDLLSRYVVQNEFRTPSHLIERIAADSGTGMKAIAPTGIESITLTIPAAENSVSILGEKLTVVRPDSEVPDTFTAAGRPIAVVSNITIEYRPGPARRTPARR
jgi:hypothetical protein